MSESSSDVLSAMPNYHPNGSTSPLPLNGHTSVASSGVPNGGAIRKKLTGYVGFANLPNQVHRKSVRKGFQFTAMVVGA